MNMGARGGKAPTTPDANSSSGHPVSVSNISEVLISALGDGC